MYQEGYVQVYTGNGKGKTTASLGLAVRAACAGNRVFIGQFMKGRNYSELRIPSYMEKIEIKQFGTPRFFHGKPADEDLKNAASGLAVMAEIVKENKYDLVIFDEINTALFFKLLQVEDVLQILKAKPQCMEIVLTGRYAPEEIIDFADLVTEMKEVKHYYNHGVAARVGIES